MRPSGRGTIVIREADVVGARSDYQHDGSASLVVHEVTEASGGEACACESYEVRPVTLAAASHLLRMQVTDFDRVRLANALEDIKRCPCCRSRPRRAA